MGKTTRRITIKAFSEKELARRIADTEKRGMGVVKQGKEPQGEERMVYWAIMEGEI